ncbi:hypothetical protein CDAR_267061 [Caerostris darwini]|uniref:Ig-like domain-containing protein n=1 Tax=Caerostris darwini TaxID=1538125 RepID=A0AAV4R437_9ARAC|nr:hypothetical protein CDAR_267061 [Caerostris darwini]
MRCERMSISIHIYMEDERGFSQTRNGGFTIRNIDEFSSDLIITRLGPEYSGNYTCRVSNIRGFREQSDFLTMIAIQEWEASPSGNIDEFSSNLVITRLGPEYSGNYTCRVSNRRGFRDQSDFLTMMGKP